MEPHRKPKSDKRAKQWITKKALDSQTIDCKAKGLPPLQVEVIKYGKIGGACHGKNVWDDYLKGLAPCILSVSIVKVSE
jgi:hypothetical protein